MKVLGITALNHDASIAVYDGEILFHEKSLIDSHITQESISRAIMQCGMPDVIAWYERPLLKKTRQLYAGQLKELFSESPKQHLRTLGLQDIPVVYVPHHLSHAACVYQSNFDSSAIIVADAIGEWDTATVWNFKDGQFEKVYSKSYPYSLGLFYSAFTELVGLVPVQDENKFMEMSKLGDKDRHYLKVCKYLTKNLHKGIWDWEVDFQKTEDLCDIAAAVQRVFEDQIDIMVRAAYMVNKDLTFTGGCAYNKLSHRIVGKYFKNFWTPEFPGDAGTSIGAAAYVYHKENQNA